MSKLSEILKKVFVQNLEKVVLAVLVIILIVTVLKSTFSLLGKLANQEPMIYSTSSEKAVKHEANPSSNSYAELIQKIQQPLPILKEEARDLFVKKTDEVNLVEPKASEALDTDNDGMPDEWETQYGLDPNDSTDAQKDLDRDSYSNLDEYAGGSDPKDSNSFPGALKLRVLNIYRKGILVNFFGYINLPDGSFQMQINWGKRTSFLKVGQSIRGFKIIDFSQKNEKKFNPQIGAEEAEDVSHIQIQKANEPPITLTIGKPSFEKELHATILDQVTGKTHVVHYGSKIKRYKVLDITPTKVKIIRNKKIYTLRRSSTAA